MTTPPQHPMRTAPAAQQAWTVWTMLLWFIQQVYDLKINDLQSQIDAISSGGSGDRTYAYTQVSAATTWNVAHNLGKFPSVSVVDTGSNQLLVDVHYVDTNNLTISLASPT